MGLLSRKAGAAVSPRGTLRQPQAAHEWNACSSHWHICNVKESIALEMYLIPEFFTAKGFSLTC